MSYKTQICNLVNALTLVLKSYLSLSFPYSLQHHSLFRLGFSFIYQEHIHFHVVHSIGHFLEPKLSKFIWSIELSNLQIQKSVNFHKVRPVGISANLLNNLCSFTPDFIGQLSSWFVCKKIERFIV